MKLVAIAIASAVFLCAANVVVSDVPHDGSSDLLDPDTFMLLFDGSGDIINANNNGSLLGNGWASGIQGITAASGFVDNGEGAFTIRIGVTGYPDGFADSIDGLFQNGPHNEFSHFEVVVDYFNAGGIPVGSDSYLNTFTSGAEAFLINFDVPAGIGVVSADVNIDNTVGGCQPTDFNDDNIVDTADLGILISKFHATGVPSGPTNTYLIATDKFGVEVAADDNSSTIGNGLGSGLFGLNDTVGFVDNGDGSRSLRLFVTGVPGPPHGVSRGLIGDEPHGQFGEMVVHVEFFDAADSLIAEHSYPGTFVLGTDSFYINFDVPPGADYADVQIDNDMGWCPDTDLNNDCVVDVADLGILIAEFGLHCGE